MKVTSYNELPIIQVIGNNTWLYHYDYSKIDIDGIEQIACEEVIISALRRSEIVRAIIHNCFSDDDEKKLINNYNAHKEGVIVNEKAIQDYFSFLNERERIKSIVFDDCLKLQISLE